MQTGQRFQPLRPICACHWCWQKKFAQVNVSRQAWAACGRRRTSGGWDSLEMFINLLPRRIAPDKKDARPAGEGGRWRVEAVALGWPVPSGPASKVVFICPAPRRASHAVADCSAVGSYKEPPGWRGGATPRPEATVRKARSVQITAEHPSTLVEEVARSNFEMI